MAPRSKAEPGKRNIVQTPPLSAHVQANSRLIKLRAVRGRPLIIDILPKYAVYFHTLRWSAVAPGQRAREFSRYAGRVLHRAQICRLWSRPGQSWPRLLLRSNWGHIRPKWARVSIRCRPETWAKVGRRQPNVCVWIGQIRAELGKVWADVDQRFGPSSTSIGHCVRSRPNLGRHSSAKLGKFGSDRPQMDPKLTSERPNIGVTCCGDLNGVRRLRRLSGLRRPHRLGCGDPTVCGDLTGSGDLMGGGDPVAIPWAAAIPWAHGPQRRSGDGPR